MEASVKLEILLIENDPFFIASTIVSLWNIKINCSIIQKINIQLLEKVATIDSQFITYMHKILFILM